MTPAPPGAWSRLRKSPVALVTMALLALVFAFAIFGPLLYPAETDPATRAAIPPWKKIVASNYAQVTSSEQFVPPCREHLFGTDVNGRDAFARTIQGARISLVVGLAGALISLVIGTSYGLVSGYVGGRTDGVMMRFVEILYSIPRLIIIILATTAFDHSFKEWLNDHGHSVLVGYSKIIILILALGCIEWLTMARIVRGQVLGLKNLQFVAAARALGQSHVRIILRHLLPNIIGIVIIYLTLTIPTVILVESFLSFLGLGVQPPQASWGSLLADGAQAINPIKSFWWLPLFPAFVMSLTLLALNFLGDALRDALDPRARR
ncbi:MAG: ABC transporter permease [Chthoniobacter sp.]|nr:ABC transporter permease [Chthoniobacter sp.]